MPLPANDIVWPPAALEPIFKRMVEHDAWYVGDTAVLQSIYSTDAPTATHVRDGIPYAGGIMGTVGAGLSRAFWGKPVTSGQTRTMVHAPIAADLATLSSDMLWAEPPTFEPVTVNTGAAEGVVDADSTKLGARLDLMFNSADAHMMFNEAGELCAALGGTFYRVAWNADTADHVYIRADDADSAVPEWADGRLKAVTFWTQYLRGEHVYRHLIRHEVGYIIHGLYRGESRKLGERVSLDALDETRWLTKPADGLVVEPLQTVIPTRIKRLTATYQPNVRKSREFRKVGQLAYFGRSVYSGIEGQLNDFDMTWSSWMRDIKAARARIFVDEAMMTSNGIGRGARFDDEQEVFSMMRGIGPQDEKKWIDAQQFAIRAAEHKATLDELAKIILRNAGQSLEDYEDHPGQVTATEYSGRSKRKESTRDRQKRYATAATTYIASVALEMDALLFPGKGSKAGVEVSADFPAESQVDGEKEARIIGLLDAAHSISERTKVERANPDWKPKRVDEEMKALADERAARQRLAPDPAKFGLNPEDGAPQ